MFIVYFRNGYCSFSQFILFSFGILSTQQLISISIIFRKSEGDVGEEVRHRFVVGGQRAALVSIIFYSD
jgi:hypothetical protein